MRKIFLTMLGLGAFSLALSLPLSVQAATLNFDGDTTLTTSGGINLTIKSGSKAESIVVNNDNTISVTVGSDTSLTIRSSNVYSFGTYGTKTCVPNEYSQVSIVNADGNGTVTVNTGLLQCSQTGGGGGGGGGGTTPVPPTNTSVVINSDNSQTESANVTLTLKATNASMMLISNYSNFSDATNWQTYASSTSWTLLADNGTKYVHVKFRSSDGAESSIVSDSIELVSAISPVTQNITVSDGGTATLSDNKAAITIPANAISGSGTVTITPTTTYTAPASGKQVVGNRVYDIKVMVNGNEIKTFSQAVTLTFTYTDSEIQGLTESTLAVYYWDETKSEWVKLGGTVDATNNKITVNTTHFTKFAVLGEKTTVSQGELVKLACAANADVNDPCKAVYYLGNDGKRYVFPNSQIYNTWYSDFSTVKIIASGDLAKYQIGGNVTYRPGVKMVKIQTDPKVYAVAKDGVLRWVKTEDIAKELYGNTWNTMIDDISAAFFVNYTISDDVSLASNYNKTAIQSASPNINTDKGL